MTRLFVFGIILRSILCAIAKNDRWILKAVKCICVDISVLLLPFSGNKVGKSLLIDDGSLPWIVKNANNEAAPIRRHIELALCHLAQHGIHPTTPLFIACAHTILCRKFGFVIFRRSKFERHYQWRSPMGACSDFKGLFSRRYKEVGIPDTDIQPHSSSGDEETGNKTVITEQQSAAGAGTMKFHFSCTL